MNKKNQVLFVSLILIGFLQFASAVSYTSSYTSNYQTGAFTQYDQPTFQQFYSSKGIDYSTFWPSLDGSCDSRGDFIVNVRPGGCSPAVVRSDLLEEQNVPVFCKLDAFKLNPIIDVASLKSVGFSNRGSDRNIAGISYLPSQVALKIYDPILNNPFMNDIGYVVVALKKQYNESSMPEFVEANLTAILTYDMQNIFGAGQTSFFLPVISDQEWNGDYNKYTFWKGKGYLRAEWIDNDKAEISIYADSDHIINKVTLSKGQTSNIINIPGFYCQAGVQLQLKDLAAGKARARIQVDDNEFWVVQNQQFLGNCYVKNIKQIGSGGQISLRCYGKDYVFRIGISEKVSFESQGQIQLGWGNSDNYLAYIGKSKKTSDDNEEQLFVVMANSPGKVSGLESAKTINQDALTYITENFDSWKKEAMSQTGVWYKNDRLLTNLASSLGASKDKVQIIFAKNTGEGIFADYKLLGSVGLKDVNYRTDSVASTDTSVSAENKAWLEDYFTQSKIKAYDIVKLYANEKDSFGEYYGAKALNELAVLAGKIKKEQSQLVILQDLIAKYPESSLAKAAFNSLNELSFYNYENAAGTLVFGTENHFIKLLQVVEPGTDEAGVPISIYVESSNDKPKNLVLAKNEKLFADVNDVNSENIEVLDIQEEQAVLKYTHQTKTGEKPVAEQLIVKQGTTIKLRTFENTFKNVKSTSVVTFSKPNYKRVAEVQLISQMPNGVSQANFSIRIGIEKRAIELSPKQTAKKIENLNNSIEDWSKTVENLGTLVKGWKAGCFATTGVLIVKNFFSNTGGKALARQEVMKNYWKTYCQDEVSRGNHASVEECYANHNSDIEKSVSDYADKISEMNTLADSLKKDTSEATQNSYRDKFKEYVKQNPDKQILINGKTKTLSEVFGGSQSDDRINLMVKDNELSVTDMRDIMLASELSKSQTEIGDKLLSQKITPVDYISERRKLEAGYNPGVSQIFGAEVQNVGQSKAIGTTELVKVSSLSESAVGSVGGSVGDKFVVITTSPTIVKDEYKNKVIYVPLTKAGNNYVLASKEGYVINEDGSKGAAIPSQDMNGIMSQMKIASFSEINSGMCNNKYLTPKVKFYETEPYKGMPAVVPLDSVKGWYAATKQILPGFGMQPYTSNGGVSSLWLCNVGANGREEFSFINDDICIQLNYETGQPQGQLMCLSEAEASRLAKIAKSAVENAASQYKKMSPGTGSINLPGIGTFPVEKAVSTVGTQCTDFMSPSDCNLMFNVCDPVLCPSSRCNLGGSYYVDDVVQSGIIGSIALCLPNFGSPSNGGVIVPVCLTGIYAGLDSYVSVLKAHKQCLEENLKTGKMVGICDEIYSIYLCEFFWRQGAPLLDMALPKLVELIYTGGKTRGGGEYMTFSSAWDNAQNSLRYFTDYYAVNAMKAFQARSTSEVGTEVCKAFISSNYPSSKKALDNLLEPESPVQFYAKFDEIAFSQATTPSTSQYKVYYHIYAGRESGHYYQVYLKNPPETAAYAGQPVIYVDSNYVGIGQYATQTKDFTAPSGYKELCVRIDTKEECGFKQVTTEFAIDYLKDMYMKEQATEEITDEKTCVSGSPSLYSLANPNIQEAGQEMLQPAIYQRGLIRVCATNNPGNSTNPSRWKNVGYCSDSRIRCWLDTDSVKEVIQDRNLENQSLSEAQQIMSGQDIASGNLLTEQSSTDRLDKAENNFNSIKFEDIVLFDYAILKGTSGTLTTSMRDVQALISELKVLIDKSLFNGQKSKAMFLDFQVSNKLTEQLSRVLKINFATIDTSNTGTNKPATSTTSPPTETGFSIDWESNYIKENGVETKYYLEKSSAPTVIYTIRDDNKKIIAIIDYKGEMSFNDKVIVDLQTLITNYKFNIQDNKFELKYPAASTTPAVTNSALSYPAGTEMQMFPDLRYLDSTIKYSMTDVRCTDQQKENLQKAFRLLESRVGNLKFVSSTAAEASIIISCDNTQNPPAQDDVNAVLLGKASPGNIFSKTIHPSLRFSMAIKGRITLYKPLGCQNVEIHELLHALGFVHSNNNISILFPTALSCSNQLTEDIISKLNILYSVKSLSDLAFSKDTTISINNQIVDYKIVIENVGLKKATEIDYTITAYNSLSEIIKQDKYEGAQTIPSLDVAEYITIPIQLIYSQNVDSVSIEIETNSEEIDKKNNLLNYP